MNFDHWSSYWEVVKAGDKRLEVITHWIHGEGYELYPNIQPLYYQDTYEQQYLGYFDKHHKDVENIGGQ